MDRSTASPIGAILKALHYNKVLRRPDALAESSDWAGFVG